MSTRGRPILVVEDNPMDLDLTLQAFEEHGVIRPIESCRDGEEPNLRADVPRLEAFLALLPESWHGTAAAMSLDARAGTHPVWKQIPFIVMTTSRERTDITAAYEGGANSYIVKPVDFVTFADIVKTIKMYWLLTNEPPFGGSPSRHA